MDVKSKVSLPLYETPLQKILIDSFADKYSQ